MNFAAAVKKESSRIQIGNSYLRSRIKIDEIEQLQRKLSAKDKEIKKLTSQIQQISVLSNKRKDNLSGLNRSVTKKTEEISELKNQAQEKDRLIQNQKNELAKINKAMVLKTRKLKTLNDENEATKRKFFIECQICLENCTQITVVFNCGHFCCSICAESLKSCHMCRNKIISKVKLYT